MKKEYIQTSESLILAVVLAIVGGFMDAYSYVCRGGVFANAETGNMVMLAIKLASFEWNSAIKYLIPITAFALGVSFSQILSIYRNKTKNFHWRQYAILLEIIVLIIIAFVPQEYNALANSVISFVCGIQVVAFSKFHGNSMATTMCTGNLRSGTQNLTLFYKTKEKIYLRNAFLYYFIILFFIIGAMIGAKLTLILKEIAILIAAIILTIAFVMMFWEKKII